MNQLIAFIRDNHIDYNKFIQLVYQGKPKHKIVLINNDITSYLIDLFCAIVNSVNFELSDNDFCVVSIVTSNPNPCSFDFKSVEDFINDIKRSNSMIKLCTSGTTGTPKYVEHSVKWFINGTRISEKYSKAVWALSYNPTHMAGLQVIFQIVLNNSSFTYLFRMDKETCYNLLQKHLVSHISATPTFYKLLTPTSTLVPSVIRVTFGGEKFDSRIIDNLYSVFPNAKFNNIYATTEYGSLLISRNDVFEINDENKMKLRVKNGEFQVLQHTHDSENSKWVSTGDIVEIINLSPMRFRFTARNTNFVNIGGERVNIEEVEGKIESLDYIKICRVFLRKSSLMNILSAEIVLITPGSKTQEQILFDFRNLGLINEHCPQIIKFVDSILTTRTGKLQR